LFEFLEFINYIDQCKPTDAIYLEFQKAFDKVPKTVNVENRLKWRKGIIGETV